MDNLEKIVDQLTAKASDIKDFCTIVTNEDMKDEVGKLKKEVEEVTKLIAECRAIDHSKVTRDMRNALQELRRQEVIMKLVIDRSGSLDKVSGPIENMESLASSVREIHWDKSLSQPLTPSTDKKSTRRSLLPRPLSSVKKLQLDKTCSQALSSGKKSVQASHVFLNNFVYLISEKEFNTIPKYLLGIRDKLEDLQRCVDDIICPCLTEKYTLLNKSNSDLTNMTHRHLRRRFLDQESYFPGHYFITEGDIARFLDTLIDKRLRNQIQMLRQLGLIKELRKNSTACYIWMIC